MILGIFAGIGTGKSLVLDILKKDFAYKVLKADDIAKSLYEKGGEIYYKLIELFSDNILDENLELDKKKIAKIIFDNPKALDEINTLIHPIVWHIIEEEIKKAKSQKINLAIEAAILPSERDRKLYDKVLTVKSEESIRRARLKQSRFYSDEKIQKILASQIGDKEYENFADYIIYNNSTKVDLEKEIKAILEKIENENV